MLEDLKVIHLNALKSANERAYKECGPLMTKYEIMKDGTVTGTDVTPGMCGFAKVCTEDLNHEFTKYLLSIGFLKMSEFDKGMAYYWVGFYSQSYEHKSIFAEEYVRYVQKELPFLNIKYETSLD